MANFIIKKDKTKEPFNAQKIKNAVIAAAGDAGFEAEEGNKIAQEISSAIAGSTSNLNEVLSVEIRARALSQLDAIAPAVAEAWRKYDKENGKE
ncbi:MAG: hypothetical protein HYT35_00210 [Candidatus Staskawiczbacteria bacterium]|nr:hypothetical protein [Candidatus Staskawiczbacteria bacterium]